MKPSFKVLNLPSTSHHTATTDHKIVTIHYKISILLFLIFFLSLSITAINPESASASVKRGKAIGKSAFKTSTKKSDPNGPSEMFLYFAKTTGNNIKNYNEYRSVVKKNETVVEILRPYGFTHADIFEFAKQNKKIFSLRQIKAGHPYIIVSEKSSEKRVKYLVYQNNTKNYAILPINKNLNCAQASETDEKKSVGKENLITKTSLKQSSKTAGNIDSRAVTTSTTIDNSKKERGIRVKQVSGVVKTTLHKTAVRMGLNKKLFNQFTSIFKNTSALRHISKGDLIQVAYQEKSIKGNKLKKNTIIAAIITSKDRSYHAYRFVYNGKPGYYDENGNSLESSFLKAPLKYREISSGFSARRFHPIKQIFQAHPGIDYAAPKGTPIKSVGDGIVICKEYTGSTGNHIKINHPGTGISEYMHMSKFHPSIKVNKRVSKGDIIGYVGMTGYATGPHLDLRFMVHNKYVDYRKLKLPQGDPLPRKFRNVFLQQVAMVNRQWNRAGKRELTMNIVIPTMDEYDVARHRL